MPSKTRKPLPTTLALAAAALLGACVFDDAAVEVSVKPDFVGSVASQRYDGSSDDLLTAGLGKTGLGGAVAPATSTTPTAAELRKLAIYNKTAPCWT